jgi:hypothetical protein
MVIHQERATTGRIELGNLEVVCHGDGFASVKINGEAVRATALTITAKVGDPWRVAVEFQPTGESGELV